MSKMRGIKLVEMRRSDGLMILALVSSSFLFSQNNIIIESELPRAYEKKLLELKTGPLEYIGSYPELARVNGILRGNKVKWTLSADTPVQIFGDIFGFSYPYCIAEPGDSISIIINEGNITFRGRGADKFRFVQEIVSRKNDVQKPANPRYYRTESLHDYFEYCRFFNQQLDTIESVVNRWRDNGSSKHLNRIRANLVTDIEMMRVIKFWYMVHNFKQLGITKRDLCKIADSTLPALVSGWVDGLDEQIDNNEFWYALNRVEVYKRYNFDLAHPELKSEAMRKIRYYELAKKKYKGRIREQLLAFMITEKTIKDIGVNAPETLKILADYYSLPGFPSYKEWVKSFEQDRLKFQAGQPAPEFTLSDTNDRPFSKAQLKGKIVLFDFWFTGCRGCIEMTTVLRVIENYFNNDNNVVFVSVSTDRDKNTWQKSVQEGKYTTGHAINLRTGNTGEEHPMIRTYSVKTFPQLYLIDAYGKIVQNPLPDPREDTGVALIRLIEHQLALKRDGPYIFQTRSTKSAHTINDTLVDSLPLTNNFECIKVQTDELHKYFYVTLSQQHQTEPSDFSPANKIFVFSDIEGNFQQLRKLLQAHKIIDQNYKWAFGNGHLVFAGDMFDRGSQVTECLWLIYSLEQQAKAAGGYVHFILGNHEIMNLRGNSNYVQEKYRDNARLLQKPLFELYGKKSELGRWLRTKNIIEKIGGLLFVHGGISREVNSIQLKIQELNAIARANIDTQNNSISHVKTLNENPTSPFWYRDYYENEGDKKRSSQSQIIQTLTKFKARRIITGHTIVADTISVHYDGKVINTDTPHAKGKSEALLIEGSKYYRVNDKGQRWLLFIDNKNDTEKSGDDMN